MDYIITTEHLTKKYKNFTSVNHVSLHIRKGSILWFSWPERGRQIHYHENAVGVDRSHKRQLLLIDGKQFPRASGFAILKRDRLFHRRAIFLRKSHRAGKS